MCKKITESGHMEKTCLECGKTYRTNYGGQKFCSYICYIRNRRRTYLEDQKLGEDSKNAL